MLVSDSGTLVPRESAASTSRTSFESRELGARRSLPLADLAELVLNGDFIGRARSKGAFKNSFLSSLVPRSETFRSRDSTLNEKGVLPKPRADVLTLGKPLSRHE